MRIGGKIMKEVKVINDVGAYDYKIIGTESEQTEKAAEEFKKALDYINHLPYNMTNTTQLIENRKKEVQEKYQIKIVSE